MPAEEYISSVDDPKNLVGIEDLFDEDIKNSEDIASMVDNLAFGKTVSDIGSKDDSYDHKFEEEADKIMQTYGIDVSSSNHSSDKKTHSSDHNSISYDEPKSTSFSIENDYDVRDEKTESEISPLETKNISSFSAPPDDLIPSEPNYSHSYEPSAPPSPKNNRSSYNSKPSFKTEEEMDRARLNNIFKTYGITDNRSDETVRARVQRTHDEDNKIRLLTRIEKLKAILDSQGIETSHITADENSEMSELKESFQRLYSKHNTARCSSLFNELMMAGAYQLENLFDGKKEWFGRKPDMVGFADTMKVKLRRIEYDTSEYMAEKFEDSKISPFWRIMLEILPSIFTYSYSRSNAKRNSVNMEAQYRDAQSELNRDYNRQYYR